MKGCFEEIKEDLWTWVTTSITDAVNQELTFEDYINLIKMHLALNQKYPAESSQFTNKSGRIQLCSIAFATLLKVTPYQSFFYYYFRYR